MAVLSVSGITPRRYLDWNITTPVMLISTILFFVYSKSLEAGKDTSYLRWRSIIKDNQQNIILIVYMNFMMLQLGLLGELGWMNLYVSNIAGFIFFIGVFYELYVDYAKGTHEGMKLFLFFLIVWTCYGFAQLLPVIPKNIMYNMLDIVAKNFYGLFIFYKMWLVKI